MRARTVGAPGRRAAALGAPEKARLPARAFLRETVDARRSLFLATFAGCFAFLFALLGDLRILRDIHSLPFIHSLVYGGPPGLRCLCRLKTTGRPTMAVPLRMFHSEFVFIQAEVVALSSTRLDRFSPTPAVRRGSIRQIRKKIARTSALFQLDQ